MRIRFFRYLTLATVMIARVARAVGWATRRRCRVSLRSGRVGRAGRSRGSGSPAAVFGRKGRHGRHLGVTGSGWGSGWPGPGEGSGPGRSGSSFGAALSSAADRVGEDAGQGGAGRHPRQSDPVEVARQVNGLDLDELVDTSQAVLNRYATIFDVCVGRCRHRCCGWGSRRDRAGVGEFAGRWCGSGSGRRGRESSLRRQCEGFLLRQLIVKGLVGTMVEWRLEAMPYDLSLPTFATASRGPDGRGFGTAREAMFTGSGWAAHEQNRRTLPSG